MNNRYVDHDMNVIIDAREYQDTGSFSEGLAAVLTKGPLGRFGYIDKSGRMVIPPQFGNAGRFSEGRARVEVEHVPGSWSVAYIDPNGKVVFQTDFVRTRDFADGVAVAGKENAEYLIQRDGTVSMLFDDLNLQVAPESFVGFSHGLLVVRDAVKEKYGYIDKTGRFVIPPKFENAGAFSEGLARVSEIVDGRELVGFIDTKGQYIIQPVFDVDYDFARNSQDFSEGLAGISNGPPTLLKDSSFDFIDKSGKVVLSTEFSYAGPFRNGRSLIHDAPQGKFGFIDRSGNRVASPSFELASDFSDGLASVASVVP